MSKAKIGKPMWNKDIPKTEEHKQKISKSLTKRKYIITADGITYHSRRDLCNALNIHNSTAMFRLKSPMWNWTYIYIA
jgi:hypothetical protein